MYFHKVLFYDRLDYHNQRTTKAGQNAMSATAFNFVLYGKLKIL